MGYIFNMQETTNCFNLLSTSMFMNKIFVYLSIALSSITVSLILLLIFLFQISEHIFLHFLKPTPIIRKQTQTLISFQDVQCFCFGWVLPPLCCCWHANLAFFLLVHGPSLEHSLKGMLPPLVHCRFIQW